MKEKFNSNWAIDIAEKVFKEDIKEYKEGDYYNLDDNEFNDLSIIVNKACQKADLLKNIILLENIDLNKRMDLLELGIEISRKMWRDIFSRFQQLKDYHLNFDLKDKRFKILRRKMNE